MAIKLATRNRVPQPRRYRDHIERADHTEANLAGADLTDADLTNAHLTNANLYRANLTNANLTNANLTLALLYLANLTSANLHHANLTSENLHRANLTNANLASAAPDLAGMSTSGLSTGNTIDADVRVAVNLSDGISPNEMAELFAALDVLSSIAVVVGPRLRANWFGIAGDRPGSTLVATEPGDDSPLGVRRIRYGSTFITDFLDPYWGYLAAVGGGGTIAGVPAVVKTRRRQKGGSEEDMASASPQESSQRLLSLLVSLARPSERRLFFAARDEKQRTRLEVQRAATRNAQAQGMAAARAATENMTATLEIAGMSATEVLERFNAAGITDHPEYGLSDEALAKVIPLLRHDMTVTVPVDDSPTDTLPASIDPD